jgi:hypothetical protein
MGDKTLYINIPQQHDRYIISEIYFTTHRQLYDTPSVPERMEISSFKVRLAEM